MAWPKRSAGSSVPAVLRRAPPQQRSRRSPRLDDGVDPERRDDAVGRNRHAAERGAERARNIDADAVGGDRRRQIVPGHQLRHDRLPGRHRQGAGGADQEREQQQIAGRRQAETDDHRVDRATRPSSGFRPRSEICACRKYRRARRPESQTDRSAGCSTAATSATINGSGSRLVISQPRRGAVHPAADIGDQCRRPDHGKGRMAERRGEATPSGLVSRGGRSSRVIPAAYARASGRLRRRRTVPPARR